MPGLFYCLLHCLLHDPDSRVLSTTSLPCMIRSRFSLPSFVSLPMEKRLLLMFSAFVGVFLVIPLFVSTTILHLMIIIFFYAYLGQSWNVLGGYAGQFSFGHAAFFGIGAYTSTLLYINLGVSPWIGMWLGGVAGLLFGMFCGFLSFRYMLKGPFFALVMLAFAEMLRLIADNWDAVGAAIGILIPLKGNSLPDFQFLSKIPYYYIMLALMIASIGVGSLLHHSKLGYYLQAIREDEDAAEALGVNIFRYKMIAMGISAFMTALGGTFYAQYLLYIDPEITFGVSISIEILLRPIVGGAGTIFGPILGSFILTPLSEISKMIFRGYTGVHLIFYGMILVVVIIFLPRGLAGLIEDWWRKRTARKEAS